MSRLTMTEIRTLIKMRGLGYSQRDIAKEMGTSQSSISHQLKALKTMAEQQGLNEVFADYFGVVILSPTNVQYSFTQHLGDEE